MTDRFVPIHRGLRDAAVIISLLLCHAFSAHADVVGRLHFSVKSADNEKPLAKAKIVMKDSAGVRPDISVTTDDEGGATTNAIDARPWLITTGGEKPDTFQPDKRNVTVVADTTTEVEVLLEPVGPEKVVHVTGKKSLIDQGNTAGGTQRNQDFINQFPAAGGNPQSLRNELLTAPGFVADSVNQAHPRGEHSSTTIFLNGFELPDVLIGRAGAFLIPETIQNLDIMTGAYAPEYGGETAAILNMTLRAGTITPFVDSYVEAGDYATYNGAITFGGQGGRAIAAPDVKGNVARAFGYFVDINARSTANALEPPQPEFQSAHNLGESESYFGNFNYKASSKDELTLTLNSAPAYTQVANRAGLPESYAPYGQGYGFGGERDASGAIASGILAGSPTPNALGAATIAGGIPSQEGLGQDIYQRDVNDFGVLNWRRTITPALTSLLSFSVVHSGQSILNGDGGSSIINGLPVDSSLEFDPTIVRNYHHAQGQGSLTYSAKRHTVKGGLLYDNEEGDESYQLVPGSQLALDALANDEPALVPAGTSGGPDVNGFPVYTVKPGSVAPTLQVHRTGFYGAGYVQDTWALTSKFTANYGLRLDAYQQHENVPGQLGLTTAQLSPRVNLAYLVAKRTVLRAAVNRLFIQPPLAQGAILGQAIQPEKLNQYDFSIERQLTAYQKVKLAYYAKNMKDQIDTGLLIPNTQIGAYTSVNFTTGNVHGVELSWDLQPKNNVGWGSYLTYTNSLAKPGGVIDGDPTMPAPVYNDHDQLNTITAGLFYATRSGANAGLDCYYGSGAGSSGLAAINPDNTAPRTPRNFLNLSLSTGPGLFGGGSVSGHGGVTLKIENITNDLSIINFNSGFSGTRFQQGRRVLLSVFGKF